MKKLLIALLALAIALTAVACAAKSAKTDETTAPKETDTTAAATETETKMAAEEFEFTFKSLKLKVSSVEDYAFDAESDSFDAPAGKYVKVNCAILEGEEPTKELSGIYNSVKLNGGEPVNVSTSGQLSLVMGEMYVGTDAIISFIFDVPADFEVTGSDFTAE